MRKICFLSGDITRSGGTEKVACQIANGLSGLYDVCIVSLCERSSGLHFHLETSISHTALFTDNPNGIKQYWQIVSRLHRFIARNHIDILIDVDTILDMFSVSAVLGTTTKLIAWEHFNFHETMGNKLRVPIRKYISRWAKCIVVLTKEDKRSFSDYLKGKSRVEQIYNPVEFSSGDFTYDLTSKTIISVGRLARQKGFDYLLESAEIVIKKHPDWQWLILGEGDERQNLEQTIAEKKLHQVKLLGRVSDVENYLRKAAIFALTSRYEGFPLVMIEAKASKLPVVSFKCKTGPAELIRAGDNGDLINCFDTEAFADAVCALIESEEKRKQYSENAKLDLEKLDYQAIIRQWQALVESM